MRPEQKLRSAQVRMKLWMAVALLLPIGVTTGAEAQYSSRPSYGSSIVVVPPTYPSGDNTGGGYGMPFSSPQAGQQRLLEMLETGGVEQPPRQATPQGCIYSGQIYSEGAIVRNEAGRQVCGQRAGAEPDASGQMPLSWRAVPGE